MNDRFQSVRPFSLGSEMDSALKERVMDHLKPLCNVIYFQGDYYIYQSESLLTEPGLTTQLNRQTQIDRFFVTNQIKSIANKASVVIKKARVPELIEAAAQISDDVIKKLKNSTEYEENIEDCLLPLVQEVRAVVSAKK